MFKPVLFVKKKHPVRLPDFCGRKPNTLDLAKATWCVRVVKINLFWAIGRLRSGDTHSSTQTVGFPNRLIWMNVTQTTKPDLKTAESSRGAEALRPRGLMFKRSHRHLKGDTFKTRYLFFFSQEESQQQTLHWSSTMITELRIETTG